MKELDRDMLNKLLEIQYLKGRLDELQFKALPNTMNLNKQRKLDVRIDKYYNKLRSVDLLSYHLYIMEHHNRVVAKQKSKTRMKKLLEDILPLIDVKTHGETYEKIKAQLHSY